MNILEIKRALSHESEEVRREGAQAVSSLFKGGIKGTMDAVALFDIALGDASWRVRKVAIEGLLSLPDNEKAIPSLLLALEADDNVGKRNSAQEALIAMGKKALPFLLRSVQHRNHEVRKFISDILGEIGDGSAIGVLSKKLLWDKDENVRVSAAEALGKLGRKEAIPYLLKLVNKNNKSSLMLVYTALESLGKLGKKGHHIPIALLKSAVKDPILRKGALDAMGWSKSNKAIPYLIRGLKDKNKAVREASLVALVNLASALPGPMKGKLKRQMGAAITDDTYRQIIRSLESYNIDVQRAAVYVLGWTKRDEAILSLVRLGAGEEALSDAVCASIGDIGIKCLPVLLKAFPNFDAQARALVARALIEVPGDSTKEALLSFLMDEDHAVRVQASLSLGRLFSRKEAPAEIIKSLVRGLDDSEEEVQKASREALLVFGHYSRKKVIEALTRIPVQSSSIQKKNAIEIIGVVGGREELNHLFFALKDENPAVRRSALQALGSLGYKEAIDHMKVSLADEDPQVRIASVMVLGQIGGGKAIKYLVLALDDEDPKVRCAALRAFRGISGPGPDDAIRSALLDPDTLVAVTAIEALRDRREGEFLRGLRRMLSHPSEDVRLEAVRSLALIRGKEASHTLSLLSRDQDPIVRDEARRLIGKKH